MPSNLLRGIDNRRLVETVRRLNPQAVIIANAIEAARGLAEAIGEALNGRLPTYRTKREETEGRLADRHEVLR